MKREGYNFYEFIIGITGKYGYGYIKMMIMTKYWYNLLTLGVQVNDFSLGFWRGVCRGAGEYSLLSLPLLP